MEAKKFIYMHPKTYDLLGDKICDTTGELIGNIPIYFNDFIPEGTMYFSENLLTEEQLEEMKRDFQNSQIE